MPVLQVSWVLFSMISGSLYYQESAAMDTLELSMFLTGTVVLLAGVWLLTTRSKVKEEEDPNKKINDVGTEDSLRELVIIEQKQEEGKDDSLAKAESGKAVVVSRRHTVNITAHGGVVSGNLSRNMFSIAEGEEMVEEREQESASVRIQRSVTAPLSGVIW